MDNTNIPYVSDQTIAIQTTVKRNERNKDKIPILSYRGTDLSKKNPKMWWVQISKYIDLTYQKKKELIKLGVDTMAHIQLTTSNVMSFGPWAQKQNTKQ